MKKILLFSLCLLSTLKAADKPNVIVIFTDDQGWADLSSQGALSDVRTPHIDKLAADGVRCTSGYITAPQCIPSRAGLLSGRFQGRFGLDQNGTIPLPLDEVLIPQRLQKAGYTTGMVGKWHLDPNHGSAEWIRENLPNPKLNKRGQATIPASKALPYQPDKRGFTDVFCGYTRHYRATFDLKGKDVKPVKTLREKGDRLDIQTNAALAFIDRHHKQPFFLYLAYYAPHVPLASSEKYLARFPGEMPERRRYALAMISAMDDGVGRIREKLEAHGLTEDTMIFYISDNGAPLKLHMEDKPLSIQGGAWDGSRNDPWVGEKGMLAEGGIRVPYIAAWPGTIPAGQTFDHPVSSLDVGATAVALAGLEQPEILDGVNLIPFFTGKARGVPHETLFWRFWTQTAVREGKWKYYHFGRSEFLFDLSSDAHEKKNLIREHPEIARSLRGKLNDWCSEMKNPGIPIGTPNGQEQGWFEHYLPKN
ncbi:MAG: sulfatase family protein [Opitutales bacterium]